MFLYSLQGLTFCDLRSAIGYADIELSWIVVRRDYYPLMVGLLVIEIS